MTPAIAVHGLTARAGAQELLRGIDFTLDPGRVLAVLGESGAGKSTLGRALLGASGPGIDLAGRVEVIGMDVLAGRGSARVAHVPQHPGAALDPVRRVGPVLDELAAVVHGAGRRNRARRGEAVARALEQAHLDPALARRFPHQLSGGEQQRVTLAMALVVAPAVVVLDEPTTGLDPVTTDEVVARLAELAADGTALVVLTHDHSVARALAHEVLVLREGVSAGWSLPAPVPPAAAAERAPAPGSPRLTVTGLTVTTGGATVLVDDVHLSAASGECLAVVGRSGAGKTSLARALAGLHAPQAGAVTVDGQRLPATVRRRDAGQRRAVQYVHQDPRASFLDHRAVLDQIARPGVLLRGLPLSDARAEAVELLDRLGVDEDAKDRRPGTLSGGQLQRAALARALVANPAVLVADEVTAALDSRHRAGLLEALDRVRRDLGTTVVLVSHDLTLVSRVADRVAVLDSGRLVEHVPVEDLWSAPASRAAAQLVASVPADRRVHARL